MPDFMEQKRRRDKRRKKRAYEHAPRNDQWRESRRIPADTGPALSAYRQKQYAKAHAAKAPREPRIVQRERKLAARKAQRERDAKLKELLAPKPIFEEAA